MTQTPLSRFKGQGHQATLLIAALMCQAAAAVSVGTHWAWETTRREVLRRPEGGAGWGHIVAAAHLQLVPETK